MFFLDHTKSAALRILSRALARWSKSVDERRNPVRMPELFDEFKNLQFSGHAIQKLLGEFEFGTVLDIGSGEGHHTDVFIRHGKSVTAIDYGKSIYFEKRAQERRLEAIVANFNDATFDRQFDCIWCSHVLEHQLDPHSFLRKVHSLLKEGGILAITVPPIQT